MLRLSGSTHWLLGAGASLLLSCAATDVESARVDGAGEQPPEAARMRAHVSRALSRSSLNLRLHQHADGGQHVEVMRGFQHATVLVFADAGVEGHCVSDADEALHLLERGTR